MTTACAATKPRRPFEGVIPNMQRRFKETDSAWVREELERYPGHEPVRGLPRLSPEAGSAGGEDRGHAYRRGLRACRSSMPTTWFRDLDKQLTPNSRRNRGAHFERNPRAAKFLNNVGLDYLTLARASGTLSGGESQRIRLASQIGSGLTGVLYVLDEPSHRPASARQREAAGIAQRPARSRQHRASSSSMTKKPSAPPIM